MKICPNCGTSVSDDATFCNNCGAALNDVKPQADQPQGQMQSAAPAQTPVVPLGVQPAFQQGTFNQQQGQGMMQQPYVAFDPKDHPRSLTPRILQITRYLQWYPICFHLLLVSSLGYM